MTRFFNRRQHNRLYGTTNGLCARCGTALKSGWHADHITPYSAGGPTNIANGQPLCPTCNLQKGARMDYQDTFDPRPFQSEVIEKVVDGFATNRHVTVALGTPGTGKTLTYQAVATHLIREGLIDYIAIFVPRVNLASDCEKSWMATERGTGKLVGNHLVFDAALRLGKIRHAGAVKPLTDPGVTGIGFVSTYAALATDDDVDPVFLAWAKSHRGRFLLVADEAQFCGGDSDKGGEGGTRSGAKIHELNDYSAHTLLLTGTPYRADGKKLVLCTYSEPDESGKQRLDRHVEATYADGIEGGYLRRFEMQLSDGDIVERAIDDSWSEQYKISSRDSNLQPVLRKPTTWEPIVDLVVRSVREKQQINADYRGLISCMEKRDVDTVVSYLEREHPSVRVVTAVSADGEAARKRLEDFKTRPADILVTVRMAFIGYDCKQITVVGVLTHYRDPGHLMQLVGRGLRVWENEPYSQQSCRIIAPDDPKMQEFLGQLRKELDEGVQRREARERRDGNGDREDAGPQSYIASTRMTSTRAVSNDAETENDEFMLIQAAKHQLGLVDDATDLARFLDLFAIRQTAPAGDQDGSAEAAESPQKPAVVLTDKEHIEEIKALTVEAVRDYLTARGVLGGNPEYGRLVAKATKVVNKRAGIDAAGVRTIEQAERRLQAAKALLPTS